MKNKIIVDIDTDRDVVVKIGKDNPSSLPKNKEEAGKQIIKDIACLTEGLVTLIQLANDNGYKDSNESINDTITHLERAFSDKDNLTVKSIKNISDSENT